MAVKRRNEDFVSPLIIAMRIKTKIWLKKLFNKLNKVLTNAF
jgi:hypothetical protein